MPRADTRVSSSIGVVAAAVWLGGMLALGAIVAPAVFGIVPAPTNANAMVVVFRRFDYVAMGCAAVVVLVEAARVAMRAPAGRLDFARLGVAVGASVLAIVQGTWLTPAIEGLHRAGAVRRVGALGLELDAKHHLAELGGKTQAILLVALLVLHVSTVSRAR